MAATATTTEKNRPVALGHPTTVHVLHEVELILKERATQALSPQSAHLYKLMILKEDNIINTPKRCDVLNPATLQSVSSDGELHHACAKVVFHSSFRGRSAGSASRELRSNLH